MRNRLAVIGCFLGVALVVPNAGAQDVVWAERMGSSSGDDGHSIAVDGSGNSYVTGRFSGTVDFGSYSLTSAGGYDIFVAKLDSNRTVQWATRMGGADFEGGYGIAVDGSGNSYVTGNFWGTADFGSYSLTPAGFSDIFVAKLDSSGTVQWAERMGGAFYDYGYGIAVDGSGNSYVTGNFWDTADFGSYSLASAGHSRDIFVAKLDSSGTVQWAERMGGSSDDYGFGIAVDGSGNSYVTGFFSGTADFGSYIRTSAGDADIFVTKLDSSGTVQWATSMGGGGGDDGRGIAVDGSGDVYVTGSFWDTADFGSYSLTSAGPGLSRDIFVAKLDSSGTVQWAERMGGSSDDWGYGIAVDGSGNSYVTGQFSGTADFGSYIRTSAGDADIFVAKLDSSGTVQWAERMGGSSDDYGFCIAVDGSGNSYVTGTFWGTADFGSHSLTSVGGSDIFVVMIGCGYYGQSVYGRLLFPPLCSRDAGELPGGPGEPYVYASHRLGIHKGQNDTFFLSSDGMSFAPLVVDDAVHCDGQGSGIGPYDFQPGVPPFILNVPIEHNLVPLPAHDITSFIPIGPSGVLFELLDTQREIYGNTAVFLVRDCGIYLGNEPETTVHWVSYDVDVNGLQSNLDVVTGLVSEFLSDQDFSRACDLGSFINTTEVVDTRGDPPAGDGYYYLVSGDHSCTTIGYGNSSTAPRNLGSPAACP